jgi:hypothetical protein
MAGATTSGTTGVRNHSDHQSSRAGVMVEVSYAEMLLGGWEIGATRRACDAYSHGVQ